MHVSAKATHKTETSARATVPLRQPPQLKQHTCSQQSNLRVPGTTVRLHPCTSTPAFSIVLKVPETFTRERAIPGTTKKRLGQGKENPPAVRHPCRGELPQARRAPVAAAAAAETRRGQAGSSYPPLRKLRPVVVAGFSGRYIGAGERTKHHQPQYWTGCGHKHGILMLPSDCSAPL